jgi:cbb3-type cytochrome oxidase subunit 3
MTISFVVLCAWPFRPGGRKNSDEAATMIFEEDDNVLMKTSAHRRADRHRNHGP